MQQNILKNTKKVIIIGAGPSGAICIKYLKQIQNLDVQCFEYKNDVGGQWQFIEKNEEELSKQELENDLYYKDYKALNSSIYDDMFVNIPKQAMSYKGFPMPEEYPDFPNSYQFYDYFVKYCKKHDLYKNIQFETYVEKVFLVENLQENYIKQLNLTQDQQKQLQEKKYMVEWKLKSLPQISNFSFSDYIVCANGHFSTPIYPEFKNQQQWDGEIEHSHYFRRHKLKNYENKTIVLYGVRSSGQDLLCLILKQSEFKPKKIYFVGDKNVINLIQENTTEYRPEIDNGKLVLLPSKIQELQQGKKILLQNQNDMSFKTIENIDQIILCTGYKYTIPFLENVNDNIIEYYNKDTKYNSFGPLYKALVSINQPTMFFPGLINGYLSIQIVFERQAIIIKQIIEGKIQLPSKEKMMEEFQNHYEFCKNHNPDMSALFKGNLKEGDQKINIYMNSLYDMVKDMEMDEEFEDLVYNKFLPLLRPIQAANYPLLKSNKYSGGDSGIPEVYASDETKF